MIFKCFFRWLHVGKLVEGNKVGVSLGGKGFSVFMLCLLFGVDFCEKLLLHCYLFLLRSATQNSRQ